MVFVAARVGMSTQVVESKLSALDSLSADPDKVAIAQIADVSFLREVQREMGIQCRDGYGC